MISGVIRWSESLERIVGIPQRSFGGTYEAFVELVHPDDRQTLRQALEWATTDDEYVAECRMGPPGAQTVQLVAQGRVVRDAFGEPVRLAGVALDVTARRELESQLRHAQKMERPPHRAARPVRGHLGQRHGCRDRPGHARPDLRAVLHD